MPRCRPGRADGDDARCLGPRNSGWERVKTQTKEVELAIKHAFAGIAVADYGAALAWYERLLGRSPDVIVTENEAMWQVAEAGWIYVVGDASRAGHALLALLVDDLESHVDALAQRGLATGAIETMPGAAVRQVVLSDPEGNRIKIFENLSTNA